MIMLFSLAVQQSQFRQVEVRHSNDPGFFRVDITEKGNGARNLIGRRNVETVDHED